VRGSAGRPARETRDHVDADVVGWEGTESVVRRQTEVRQEYLVSITGLGTLASTVVAERLSTEPMAVPGRASASVVSS
jgi:hypothetical protein